MTQALYVAALVTLLSLVEDSSRWVDYQSGAPGATMMLIGDKPGVQRTKVL